MNQLILCLSRLRISWPNSIVKEHKLTFTVQSCPILHRFFLLVSNLDGLQLFYSCAVVSVQVSSNLGLGLGWATWALDTRYFCMLFKSENITGGGPR